MSTSPHTENDAPDDEEAARQAEINARLERLNDAEWDSSEDDDVEEGDEEEGGEADDEIPEEDEEEEKEVERRRGEGG